MIEYIRNLQALVEKSPQEQDKPGQVKALTEESNRTSVEIKALQAEIDPLFNALQQNSNEPKAMAQLFSFVAKSGKIANGTKSMMTKTTKLTGEVVKDLQARKKTRTQLRDHHNAVVHLVRPRVGNKSGGPTIRRWRLGRVLRHGVLRNSVIGSVSGIFSQVESM